MNQPNSGGQCNVEVDADGKASRVCSCFDGVAKWDDSHICDVGPCQDSPYYQPDGPLWNPCHHGGTCKAKALNECTQLNCLEFHFYDKKTVDQGRARISNRRYFYISNRYF